MIFPCDNGRKINICLIDPFEPLKAALIIEELLSLASGQLGKIGVRYLGLDHYYVQMLAWCFWLRSFTTWSTIPQCSHPQKHTPLSIVSIRRPAAVNGWQYVVRLSLGSN